MKDGDAPVAEGFMVHTLQRVRFNISLDSAQVPSLLATLHVLIGNALNVTVLAKNRTGACAFT